MDEKKKISGEEFIEAVCTKVRFKPAREQIAAELRAHLEDRTAMLEEHGFPPGDAAARAAASMGDPEEIGTALDKEHSPLWGWMAVWTDVARYLVLFLVGLMVLLAMMGADWPTPMRPMAAHDRGAQVSAADRSAGPAPAESSLWTGGEAL